MSRALTLEKRLEAVERQINRPYSVQETALLAGVSRATVYRWMVDISAFGIKGIKEGKHYRRIGKRWIILDPEAIIKAFSR